MIPNEDDSFLTLLFLDNHQIDTSILFGIILFCLYRILNCIIKTV